jgi:hypothetical protein
MYFRILQNIATKGGYIKRGDICRLGMKEKHLERLIQVGAISPLYPPELDDLPGWEERQKILKRHKITTVDALFAKIEDDPITLAGWFELSPADVIGWKQEIIRDWLVVGR